jgi:hypothetical protein
MPCPPLAPGLAYGLIQGNNIQVTHSAQNQCRSESMVAVNPTNPQNLICTSKKFFNPQKYQFVISTSYSMDGGQTWTESPLTMLPGWDGMTDPDLTFDAFGNAYLIVEPDLFGADITAIGMYVYKSTNGGKTWNTPVQLHLDPLDDKQWIDADINPSSPHYGNVYAIWAANTPLRFARSSDHGVTWKGIGNSPSGSDVSPDFCYAPALAIGEDGTIHISWHVPGSSTISYTRSTDGGNTFAPVISSVTGVQGLESFLPQTDGWAHFNNATFRVLTIVTSCIAAGNQLIVAWADLREGVSRIYYRIATNNGTTWIGPDSGQALLPTYGQPQQSHFHPQLCLAGNKAVGCAFYEFGPKNGKHLIDVMLTESCSDGNYFVPPIALTDQPWDPAIDAPWSHGDPNVTFIGEYFGLGASYDWFAVVWTDTRTGVQELFFNTGALRAHRTIIIPSEVAQIIAGVVQDGGGLVVIGGKIIRIPPWDPWIDVLYGIAAIDSINQIQHAEKTQALASVGQIITTIVGKLTTGQQEID